MKSGRVRKSRHDATGDASIAGARKQAPARAKYRASAVNRVRGDAHREPRQSETRGREGPVRRGGDGYRGEWPPVRERGRGVGLTFDGLDRGKHPSLNGGAVAEGIDRRIGRTAERDVFQHRRPLALGAVRNEVDGSMCAHGTTGKRSLPAPGAGSVPAHPGAAFRRVGAVFGHALATLPRKTERQCRQCWPIRRPGRRRSGWGPVAAGKRRAALAGRHIKPGRAATGNRYRAPIRRLSGDRFSQRSGTVSAAGPIISRRVGESRACCRSGARRSATSGAAPLACPGRSAV